MIHYLSLKGIFLFFISTIDKYTMGLLWILSNVESICECISNRLVYVCTFFDSEWIYDWDGGGNYLKSNFYTDDWRLSCTSSMSDRFVYFLCRTVLESPQKFRLFSNNGSGKCPERCVPKITRFVYFCAPPQ